MGEHGTSDADLLAAYTAGDTDAFARLVERHGGMVYHTCLRVTGERTLAEDAAQAALAILARKARMVRSRAAAFLHGVAVNVARRARDAELARRAREKEAAAMRRELLASADEPADWGEVRPRLDAALGRLPRLEREAVVRHYLEGASRPEVAAALGVPEGTVSSRLARALVRLRRALAREGAHLGAFALAPMLAGRAAEAACPAMLAAKAPALAAAGAGLAGALGPQVGVLVEGGLKAMFWMKAKLCAAALAGALVAGTVAGAAVRIAGSSPAPLASAGSGEPAPVNPYNGMQEREEVYEFTQKPAVTKEGDKWVITFASKGKCDATVAILDKDGKIIRHLASGVLGVNAPHPFQQNTLSQKVEWDGEDDTGEKAPAGCKVRVSLGLKAEFEKNIAYSPYSGMAQRKHGSGGGWRHSSCYSFVAPSKNGEVTVGTFGAQGNFVRVYDKDKKYLRTLFPPSAAEVEKLAPKLGWQMAETIWGDKVSTYKTWYQFRIDKGRNDAKAIETLKILTGIDGFTKIPHAETGLPLIENRHVHVGVFQSKNVRLAVNLATEELYGGSTEGVYRYDGKTGELDKTWFIDPKDKLGANSELHVGPDGLLYMRIGIFAYGRYVVRLDRAGKMVPFKENAFTIPAKEPMTSRHFRGKPGALWTGVKGFSNTHQRGLYVSPKGFIVAGINEVDSGWAQKHGLKGGNQRKKGDWCGNWAVVWDKNGKLLSADAAGGCIPGGSHGMAMDRDGNLYTQFSQTFLPGQKSIDGIKDMPLRKNGWRRWGGVASVVKFRGLGGKYPLNVGPALKTMYNSQGPKPQDIPGGLWAYAGANQCMGCTCHNTRWTLDYWARTWIPAHHLYSIMVIDANGNRVVRLGRYGNVDDTEKDLREKRDGLRFAWARAVAVSDTAMYVTDAASRRVLKAKLGYHAEETVALDGSASASASTRAPAPAPAAPAPRTPEVKPAVAAKQDAPAAASASVAAAPAAGGSGPNSAVVCRGWWSLAMSYKRAGRKDKAREYFRRIIAQHPDTDYAARARRELARL